MVISKSSIVVIVGESIGSADAKNNNPDLKMWCYVVKLWLRIWNINDADGTIFLFSIQALSTNFNDKQNFLLKLWHFAHLCHI